MLRTLKQPNHPIRSLTGISGVSELSTNIRAQRAQGVCETTNGTVNIRPMLRIKGQAESFQYHFQVEQKDKTNVKVHAGQWIRHNHGVEQIVKMNTDDGISDVYEDVMTLTISADCYIVLTLDEQLEPAFLDPSVETFVGPDDDNVIKVLAYVTWDSTNSKIKSIEQWWTGGNIADYYEIPDSAEGSRQSIENDADDFYLQLYNFKSGSADTNVVAVAKASDNTTHNIDYVPSGELSDADFPKDVTLSPGEKTQGSKADFTTNGVSRADHRHYLASTTADVITSIRYDTTTHKLQYKTTQITALAKEDEVADWIDFATAEACPTT